MGEFFRFCIVGAITFIIDYGLLFLLTEYLRVQYLLSSGIAFAVAVVINYILCLFFVFNDSKRGCKQLSLFILTSIVGLLLNQICMWVLVEVCVIYYMFAKVISTGIVMIWNYITKKKALSQS